MLKTVYALTLIAAVGLLSACSMKGADPYAKVRSKYGTGETTTGGIGKGTLRRVHFGFDKATLHPEDKKHLKYNIERMKKDPKMVILVEGHTDARGSAEYNIALGEERAKAAENYVRNSGIPANRIKMKSWGEEKHLAKGTSDVDHAANRRAEFVILEKSDDLN